MRSLLFLLLLTCVCQGGSIPVIFDTDIGSDIDDAFALAFLLQSPELETLAVTTTRFDAETRARLAWKVMGAYGRHDIPLASGGGEALLHTQIRRAQPQFGVLGPDDILPEQSRSHGVQLIIDTLLASPRKVTLVPVGPLTNIALALKTDPRIKDKIERIVLMGGAFQIFQAESNIVNDYGAAAIVFSSGVPITAVSIDVTRLCVLERASVERIRQAGHPASQLLVQLMERWQGGGGSNPVLHDALAVAVAFRPELCQYEAGQVEVEYAGTVTRGMTRFTPRGRAAEDVQPTTLITRKVDVQAFLDLLVSRVAASPRVPK